MTTMDKFLLISISYLNGAIHYSLNMYNYGTGRCIEQEVDFCVDSETGRADIKHVINFIEGTIKSTRFYIHSRSEDLIKNF